MKTIQWQRRARSPDRIEITAAQSAFDKDAVKLDPPHNKVLFENDRVRVVVVHFGLGEKGPVVDKRPRVIILLNDMHADVARKTATRRHRATAKPE